MGGGEDGAAGVRGRVYDDGRRVEINQGLHMGQVDLPILVGQQVVLSSMDAQPLGERLVERKAGPGHQEVLSVVSQG